MQGFLPGKRKRLIPVPWSSYEAWCWLGSWGGWLGILGSWVWALLVTELTPGGVDSACHHSKVGEMSTSVPVIGALHQQHRHIPNQWCNQQPQGYVCVCSSCRKDGKSAKYFDRRPNRKNAFEWTGVCENPLWIYKGLFMNWCMGEPLVGKIIADLPTFSRGMWDRRLQFNHGSLNKSRWRDLCRRMFLTPKRQDYFGRGCHLVSSCPSREDLLWIKGGWGSFYPCSMWQCCRRLYRAPNDPTAIASSASTSF